MSYITKINGVKVRSVSALRAVVAELKKEGVNCTLEQGGVPRMYYGDQFSKAGYGEQVDFTLKLSGRYDIGFCKETSGKNKGCYTAVFDSYGGDIARSVGSSADGRRTGGMSGNAADIGKLMQKYSKHLMLQTAQSKGMTVQGMTTDANGQLHLTVAS